jgi:hypothetical protein
MQPSNTVLTKCPKDMFTRPDQRPIYLIMDALDESPITSGIPSARERVLQLLKDLVDLGLPKLHICVTSRPERDIQNAIEPLTSLRVSLHDQTGQEEDIADYVRTVVYSNSDTNMRRWKQEDKELVVKTLAERADSMYVDYFTLVILVQTIKQVSVGVLSVGSFKGLSSTERSAFSRRTAGVFGRDIRADIKKPNRDHARRLLRCIVVAIRPLRVEEYAEILAVNFADAEGIPKLKPVWRWEDQERALLTSCSSLIAIVDTGRSRVVQFSRFSVKEYLISARLATSSQDVSRYHIVLEPAHTIMALACVSVLLQLDDRNVQNDVEENAPLARYAAEYWVNRAQFEDVGSRIKGMKYVFDLDKPYFAAWRELYDIDAFPSAGTVFVQFAPISKSDATPLYYAALCGFPKINGFGGYYVTPAVAALAGRYFQLSQLLHRNGSSVDPRGFADETPLHSAAFYGDLEMVQVLLDYGVDVNAQARAGSTPLNFVIDSLNDRGVVRLSLDPRCRSKIYRRGTVQLLCTGH